MAGKKEFSAVGVKAFSACYMDAATKTTSGEIYNVLFGQGALNLPNDRAT